MTTVRIKLDFKTRKLLPPSVHIYLGDHGIGKGGRALLSPELIGEQEFDKYIDFSYFGIEASA